MDHKFITYSLNKKLRLSLVVLASCLTVLNAESSPPVSTEYKLKAAENIDLLVGEMHKSKKIATPEQASDEKFVRRTYLTVVGRIPTLDELNRYIKNKNPYKKEMLSQQLLNSSGYVSHMTNYYFDLFRVTEAFGRGTMSNPYQEWLRKAVSKNKKWDLLAADLVNAKGHIWENGAVGYHARDMGMELDNLAMTVRLFTGTSMECAQCHDHPYNEIERMDFYKLAAFSHGTKKSQASSILSKLEGEERQKDYALKNEGKKGDRTLFNFIRTLRYNLTDPTRFGGGDGRIKLPNDYQYKDAKPNELVGAKTPFEESVRMSASRNGKDGTDQLTNWMTKDNARFTSVIANRMWKRIMGTGIYEPVDEFVDPKKTLSPKLTAYLSTIMLDVDYNLKDFQHILLLTNTYGFDTSPKQVRTKFYDQEGRQLDRMSAEQIWDSFITLKEGNPDQLAKRQFPKVLKIKSATVGTGKKDLATISKELSAISSNKEMRTYVEKLYTQSTGGSDNDPDNPDDSMMMMRSNIKGGGLNGFARASELSTPASPSHMLREFGQSDRELIENSSTEANVPQILSILNGHVEKVIVSDKGAHVYKAISKKASVEENITNLFLATLTRKPNPTELIIFKKEIEAEGNDGYSNIIAALLTSREFLFIQ